jgi:hypothetical protein
MPTLHSGLSNGGHGKVAAGVFEYYGQSPDHARIMAAREATAADFTSRTFIRGGAPDAAETFILTADDAKNADNTAKC